MMKPKRFTYVVRLLYGSSKIQIDPFLQHPAANRGGISKASCMLHMLTVDVQHKEPTLFSLIFLTSWVLVANFIEYFTFYLSFMGNNI